MDCSAQPIVTLTNQITGLGRKPQENVQKRLVSAQHDLGTPLTVSKIQILHQAASAEIKKALEPYGFFRAEIHGTLQHAGNQWFAKYAITPGPPLRITHLSVTIIGPGKDDPEFIRYLRKFPLQVGQPLHTKKYQAVKQALFNIAQLEGYLNANFTTHSIAIDLKNYTADITLQFATGPRFYFGALHFSSTPYDAKFLQRYVSFKKGAPYSSKEIAALQNNLGNTIYFQQVAIHADQANAANYYVPINIALTPRPSQQYSLGAGYGTDTGVRGSLGWEWRRITSGGDYMQAVVQASQIQNNFQARYVIPGSNPVTEHYSLLAGVNNNQPGYGRYRTYKFGGDYVSNIDDWQRIISLTYQHERFNVFTNQPTTLTEYIVPQMSFEKVKADNRINTNQGYRIHVNTAAGTSINVSSHFVQGELQAKFITTLDKKNRFIFRSDLGYTAVRDINLFPLSLRFFAGGAQSVRGYTYQSLGPGRYLVVGSAEYQYEFCHNWGSAIFFDAGNAFNNSAWKLHKSAGLGIVWHSPMGPFELSIARVLTNPSPKFLKSFRIQFVMGPDL